VDFRGLRNREKHFLDGVFIGFFQKSVEGHEKKGDEFLPSAKESKKVQKSSG
jgi:hypothetical protein